MSIEKLDPVLLITMFQMKIVQFRVCYDRWIKRSEDAFSTGLASIWSNIYTNSNEKKTCLLLCLLSIFKFQTLVGISEYFTLRRG